MRTRALLGKVDGVLREFREVQQEAGGARRRWFEDEALDLIVWNQADGSPAGFQLCYPAPDQREFALTWRAGHGFSHGRVDAGNEWPEKNLSPVVDHSATQAVPGDTLLCEFLARSAQIDPALRQFVADALQRKK